MTDLSSAGLDMVLLHTKKIGQIEIAAVVQETYTDTLEITSHPVDGGPGGPRTINDHAFKKPREVVMQCGWSNADYEGLLGATAEALPNGQAAASDYVTAVYTQLLALQESREPFDLITCRRKYSNMLIQSLKVDHNKDTQGSLRVTANLVEVQIVHARETAVPPLPRHADARKTGGPMECGTRNATVANPRSP
ncbi:hypothetical protein LMG3458_04694 [Achromobacter deleyi]|uniref:Dit-like phage tail protein N-terminal domain-containing protein n=1 Tax=Achromobacter deleyi TaxID=1353891 RepID=A0A6S7AF88_9BURK|nr:MULTISPECIES: hypothetical protein [Achromobacter]CAB3729359.1 hypothetical protein LMG3458_04694 [Achromobacter deleyi]CAB3841218.1 hypothetical protein LMG3412_01257 [Achromobacter deleyi]CAB3864128.1 hypothetical protein LMG3481_02413 [Achromobacter deleyi]CAB3906120.1 hypothetical protein LMG3482_04565 [Achromobacter deleyi]